MFLWIILATLGMVAADPPHCGGGDPCIYVNRDGNVKPQNITHIVYKCVMCNDFCALYFVLCTYSGMDCAGGLRVHYVSAPSRAV